MKTNLHAAHTLWLTGLSGAGKSTLAQAYRDRLALDGRLCVVLDGDTLRAGLCSDLGFGAAARSENIRRAAELARLLNDNGLCVVAALITPLASDRVKARGIVNPHPFFEVHVATPVGVCEHRDPKGLYQRARRGELVGFTGVSAPYEAPQAPDLRIDTSVTSLAACVQQLCELTLEPCR